MATLVERLHTYEQALRHAFAAGGLLSAAAAEAQASRRLSVTCGHQVFAALAGANAEVGDAIGRAAEAHRLLETLARRMGEDVQAYGDNHKYPGDGAFTSADGSRLSVVA